MNAQSARAPSRGSTTIGAGYAPSAAPPDIPPDVETVARVVVVVVVDALLRASYDAARAVDAVNAASAAAQQRPARPSEKYPAPPRRALLLPPAVVVAVVVEDAPTSDRVLLTAVLRAVTTRVAARMRSRRRALSVETVGRSHTDRRVLTRRRVSSRDDTMYCSSIRTINEPGR